MIYETVYNGADYVKIQTSLWWMEEKSTKTTNEKEAIKIGYK